MNGSDNCNASNGPSEPPKRPRLSTFLRFTGQQTTEARNLPSDSVLCNADSDHIPLLFKSANSRIHFKQCSSKDSEKSDFSKYPGRSLSMHMRRRSSKHASDSRITTQVNTENPTMQVVPSPDIRMRDVFRALLRSIPDGTSIFEALVRYGDAIGATTVKFLINEKVYQSRSLINPVYQRYQGPALCAYYDCVLGEQQWEELVCFQSEHAANCQDQRNPQDHITQFLSIFRLSDFAVVASGQKVAFIDPSERLSVDEKTFVAFFDLDNDVKETRLLVDQFAPMLDGPMISMNISAATSLSSGSTPTTTTTHGAGRCGTMIRLPLRYTCQSDSLSNELFSVDNVVDQALEFSHSLAELCLLFCRNVSSICAFKSVESLCRAHEQLFSWELSQQQSINSSLHQLALNQSSVTADKPTSSMRKLLYAVIDGATVNNELPTYCLAVLRVSCAFQNGTYYRKDWILCARCNLLTDSNGVCRENHRTSTLYLAMPLHQTVKNSSINVATTYRCCQPPPSTFINDHHQFMTTDEDMSSSVHNGRHTGSPASSSTLRTIIGQPCRQFVFNNRQMICLLTTTDHNDSNPHDPCGQLKASFTDRRLSTALEQFSRFPISCALRSVQFCDLYVFLCREMVSVFRKHYSQRQVINSSKSGSTTSDALSPTSGLHHMSNALLQRYVSIVYSLLPDNEQIAVNNPLAEVALDLWLHLGRHELFYSVTDGWGFVSANDMMIIDRRSPHKIRSLIVKLLQNCNVPVVDIPDNLSDGLDHYLRSASTSSLSSSLSNPSEASQNCRNFSTTHVPHLQSSTALSSKATFTHANACKKQPSQLVDADMLCRIIKRSFSLDNESDSSLHNSITAPTVADGEDGSQRQRSSPVVSQLRSLDQASLILLLDYILTNSTSPTENLLNLPLLPLANGEFIYFNDCRSPSKNLTESTRQQPSLTTVESKRFQKVFIIDQRDIGLFVNSDDVKRQLCSTHGLSAQAIEILQSSAFQEVTQVQTMTPQDFSQLIVLPCEWKTGDFVVTWPKHHQYFNLLWLENTWKYIREKMPNDLSPIENFNLVYVNNHRERYITIYKLARNQSTLMYCSKEFLLNPSMSALQRILAKLDIAVIDGFPDIITGHSDFSRFVPKLDPIGLLRLLTYRVKVDRGNIAKLNHSMNNFLSDKEVANLRNFLAQINKSDISNNNENLECLKQLPIFESAVSDTREKYISISQSSGLFYENGPKMPNLSVTKSFSSGTLCTNSSRSLLSIGQNNVRPCIHTIDASSKKLLELMNQRPVEFTVACRQIVLMISDLLCAKRKSDLCNSSSGFAASVSQISSRNENENDAKIVSIGKWLLVHCNRLISTDNVCQESVRPLQLFQNAAMELCAANQLIDPCSCERYKAIMTPRLLPSIDICSEQHFGLLRILGMRPLNELRGIELVDICQSVQSSNHTQRTKYHELLAQLLLIVLQGNCGRTILNEPVFTNTGIRCSFKVFLSSFPWVPVMQNRPQGYPSSLKWTFDQHIANRSDEDHDKSKSIYVFMAPNEVLDKRQSFIGGSEVMVADLNIKMEDNVKFGFKKCGVDTIVKHLRNVITSHVKLVDRTEYLEYLTLTKECYDALQKLDFMLVQAEFQSVGLKEWIWNGSGGFSAPESIFLLDKSHPVADFFTVVPYEMYGFIGFFELMGVRRQPSVSTILDLLSNSSFENEMIRKSKEIQSAFFKWAFEIYNDRRVMNSIGELEQKCSMTFEPVLRSTFKHANTPTDSKSNTNSTNLSSPVASKHLDHHDSNRLLKVDNGETLIERNGSSIGTTNFFDGIRDNCPTAACKRNAKGDPKLPMGDVVSNKINDPPLATKNGNVPSVVASTPDSTRSRRITIHIPSSIVKGNTGIVETFKFAVTSIIKNREVSVQCAASHPSCQNDGSSFTPTTRSLLSESHNSDSTVDHYKLYDEILLPNLNVFSRNVKDTIVLFALDNCDIEMKGILKRHLCIPVSPNGHTLRRPGRLIHPKCMLAIMYADIEGFFPYGSEDTYLRKDRLDVLRLLGMKFDEVSWSELCERAELVANIKDWQFAQQRARGVIAVLRNMLSHRSTFKGMVDFNDEIKRCCRSLSTCAFYPTMEKPHPQYSLRWAEKSSSTRLARPSDIIERKYWQVASATYPVAYTDETTETEAKLLDFHKPTVADCLNQLYEISRMLTPVSQDLLEYNFLSEMTHTCYNFIIKSSKHSDFNQTSVRDFFARNRVLFSNGHLYFSNQVFSEIAQSVPPYFISFPSSGLPLSLMQSILAISPKPTINQLFSYIRIGASNCNGVSLNGRSTDSFWTSQFTLYNLIGDLLEGIQPTENQMQIPDDLPVPDAEGRMHPLVRYKQQSSNQCRVHFAVDYRFQLYAEIVDHVAAQSEGRCLNSTMVIPDCINGNLREILCKLDHPSIDRNLRAALDDRNANIILEFLIAADRHHSFDQLLSTYHAHVLLSYFNDQLQLNNGNFQKLRELKLFQSIWPTAAVEHTCPSSSSSNGSSTLHVIALTSIDQYKQVFLVSNSMASLLTSIFDRCPLNQFDKINNNHLNATCRNQSFVSEQICVLKLLCHGSSKTTDLSVATADDCQRTYLNILKHLHIDFLDDEQAFLQICLPFIDQVGSGCSNVKGNSYQKVLLAIHYLYNSIFPNIAINPEKRRNLQDLIAKQLKLPNCETPVKFVHCSSLYYGGQPNVRFLSDFVDAEKEFLNPVFSVVADFIPINKVLPSSRVLEIAKQIESAVHKCGHWTDELRQQSMSFYRLVTHEEQKQGLASSGINIESIAFLEPFKYSSVLVNTVPLFESGSIAKTVLSMADGISREYSCLAWSTSFVAPEFVETEYTRPVTPQLVLKHLVHLSQCLSDLDFADMNNLDGSETLKADNPDSVDCFIRTAVSAFQHQFRFRQELIVVMKSIYQYLDDYFDNRWNVSPPSSDSWSSSEILDELRSKPIIFTDRTIQLVSANKIVLNLPADDEVPPFIYTVPRELIACPKCYRLFQRIGCREYLQPKNIAGILSKMARVCQLDYLNSNEVRKVLKLSKLFFRLLEQNRQSTTHFDFDGLFLLTGQLRLEKSSDVIIMDQREQSDYIVKLPNVSFLFNPNESVLNLRPVNVSQQSTTLLRDQAASINCTQAINATQRPKLFSERYEQTFSVVIPDDHQRQRVLHALERKFIQLLNSRTLHRCLARMLADAMARSKEDMRIVNLDEMEMLLRSRMSLIRVVCCEHLETNLVDRNSNEIIDATTEERAVLLSDYRQHPPSTPHHHGGQPTDNQQQQQIFVLHLSFKHAEQSYFNACLSKALLPLFNDVRHHFDPTILASLISCSIAHMGRLLDLLGLCTDETVLSTLKLNYVPEAGRLYGDEISLLAPYSPDIHHLTIGDLCVYKRCEDSALVYCRFLRLGSSKLKVFILADQEISVDSIQLLNGAMNIVIPTASNNGNAASSVNSTSTPITSSPIQQHPCEIEIPFTEFYVLENWSRIQEAVNVKPITEQEFDQRQKKSNNQNDGFGGGCDDISGFAAGHSCSIVDLTDEEREMLDNAKLLVDSELREVYSQFSNSSCPSTSSSSAANAADERKKRIKRLLLKWHPDKNQGNEKFASEVFKHVKKQVELYDVEMPFCSSLGSFSTIFNNFKWPGTGSSASTTFGDRYPSKTSSGNKDSTHKEEMFSSAKFGGSFDNLHSTGGFGNFSTSAANDAFSFGGMNKDDATSETSHNVNSNNIPRSRSGTTTPPSRSNSFRSAREEWQWRRMQGFGRRAGLFNNNNANDEANNDTTVKGNNEFRHTNNEQNASTSDEWKPTSHWSSSSFFATNTQPNNGNNPQSSSNTNSFVNKGDFQLNSETQRWLRQANADLASAMNDIVPSSSSGISSYEWACYKCYRAAEKALKAYHLSKCPGKILATDIPTLLFGVDSEIRSVGYRLYKWLGDPNKMHYPNLARFSKIPNEVYTITQAEKSLEYGKELVRKIEEVMNRLNQNTQPSSSTTSNSFGGGYSATTQETCM